MAILSFDWICTKDAEGHTVFRAEAEGKDMSKEEVKEAFENFNESAYEFRIVRIKDKETKKEYLKITSSIEGVENGTLKLSPSNISQGLIELREYGIFFSDDNSKIKLERCINRNYNKITLDEKDTVYKDIGDDPDSKLNSLLYGVGEYILATEEKVVEGLCYIPVADFDEIALDCGYRLFESNSLRRKLKEDGYIHTSENRFTIVARVENKPKRVLAFQYDVLKERGYLKKPMADTQEDKV